MDSEIQFGKLEQPEPQPRCRPDCDRQYETAGCGQLDSIGLPIFVDLDVMRDMEGHARTNTRVELGGVLLGGKFVDDQGRPFVMIEQSLRAEHYEATRGSFKFTHDTWARIMRDRAEFPENLQLVGWYHTHPDWGVFLSGMDMFICENFFADTLDVALVIDPCRGDRGWFHWSDGAGGRVKQRAGGFYLFANRFRRAELLYFASELAEVNPAYHDSRYESSFGGSDMQPVVHLHQQQSAPQMIALMGMLTIQMLVVVLLAWRVLFPPPVETNMAQHYRNQVYREILGNLANDSQIGGALVERVEDLGKTNVELRTSVEGQAALIEQLQNEQESLQRNSSNLLERLSSTQSDNQSKKADIDALNRELANIRQGKPTGWLTWPLVAGLAVVCTIAGLAGGHWWGITRNLDYDGPGNDSRRESIDFDDQHEIGDD